MIFLTTYCYNFMNADTEELTVIAFDIRNDQRRHQIGRLLLGFGERIQESVFEAWLCAGDLIKIRQAIREQIDETEDRVVIYRLTDDDRKHTVTLGPAVESRPPDFHLL